MDLGLSCEAAYYSDFISKEESNTIFNHLIQNFDLTTRIVKLANGESHPVNFGKVMFMDQNLFEEKKLSDSIWGNVAVWSKEIHEIKEKIELFTGHQFQVCVCIYYPDGNSGVDFHSDFVAFGSTDYIPSISLGEERKFVFRNKMDGKKTSLELANGSLVIMGNKCQEFYEHALPEDPIYKNPRINLTFRKFEE